MSEKKHDYPDKLEIKPLDRPVNATIRVPGSKSITNRALVLAALASRNVEKTYLVKPLVSDDTELMVNALKTLGFKLRFDNGGWTIPFFRQSSPDVIPAISGDLFVGNSGTTMRFLAALVSIGCGQFRLFGDERMH